MLTHSASSLDSGPAAELSYEPSPPAWERITRPAQAALPAGPRERYGRRGADPKVLGVVLALHVALVALLILAPTTFKRTATHATLKTFEISQPPPPPPSQEVLPPQPDLPVPELVTPPPVVSMPLPAPVLTAPEPPPVRTVTPPAPTVAAAPVQAVPAPVTPPDFRAAQLSNPAPAYPFLSRRAHEEGVVMLKVLVTPQGQAGEIAISKSSGFERLDDAAVKTVKRWRFVPARQAGAPVEAWVLVPVTFSLG